MSRANEPTSTNRRAVDAKLPEAFLDRLTLAGSRDAARAMRVECARLGKPLGLPRDSWKASSPHALHRRFSADWARAVVAYARVPSRAYWDWFEVRTHRLEPLYHTLTAALRAAPHLPRGLKTSVHVDSAGPVEASPLQVRGAVMHALESGLNAVRVPDGPDLRVDVRASEDGLIIAEDLAGSLSHRGYRAPRQQAPLREHLGAQMVALSHWRPEDEPLIDPMCGSGTILAEAWGWARGEPVQRVSRWMSPSPVIRPEVRPRLWGFEREVNALSAARFSFQTIGALDDIRLSHRSISKASSKRWTEPTGVILANPPYGVRLSGEGLEALRSLRAWFMQMSPGWRLFVLGLRDPLETVFPESPSMLKRMPNGPLPTVLMGFHRDRLSSRP